MRQRKVPLRKCVACQEMITKKQLIRIVKTPEGEILFDPSGKKSGRGAYLCGSASCIQIAKKNHSLEKALKHSVPLELYDHLEIKFQQSQDVNKYEP